MIIFLYGQDTYRLRQKLNEIAEYYKKLNKSGMSLNWLDGQSLEFQDFKNQTETVSMFKEKKLIIIEDIFSNQKFKEEFLKQGEKFKKSDDIILITEIKKIAANDLFLKFLKKNSKTQEFKLLEGERLKGWARKEFLNYETEIEPGALNLLINYTGNDLWFLSNEIKKLVNYSVGKKVTARDINLLVRPKIEANIFKTIDAIALRNKKQALELLHEHLEKGDAPLYLLAMINFQLRNLLTIKSGARLRAHPYLIIKTTQQARNFSLDELKKIYQKIFQADLNIKTGKISPEAALDLLIAEI